MFNKERILSASYNIDPNFILVHLDEQYPDMPYIELPAVDDGSDDWGILQSWIDEGNEVLDDLAYARAEDYKNKRVSEYPSLEEQLDYIYHNGVDAWKSDVIQPIKDKYPKPSE